MKEGKRIFIGFLICISLGGLIGFGVHVYQAPILNWLAGYSKLYKTNNSDLIAAFSKKGLNKIAWANLLPENEKAVLEKYQQNQASTTTEITNNILRSLEAASDPQYQQALTSFNTVESLDGMAVSIAGFIVPIDYAEDKSITNLFIVPYFGACIHFPPPAPNQMIFASLDEGFTEFEITQAYRLEGIITLDLFEDPLGSAAYRLDVVSIEPFFEEPDDFRQH